VHERLPAKSGRYSVKRKHGDEISVSEFDGGSFTNYHGYAVTHWLDKKPPHGHYVAPSTQDDDDDCGLDDIANPANPINILLHQQNLL
jgi:hypothetical protein